jgi:hypothetical protein
MNFILRDAQNQARSLIGSGSGSTISARTPKLHNGIQLRFGAFENGAAWYPKMNPGGL